MGYRVDEVAELLEGHPICRRTRAPTRCQLFIADLWKSDPNMAAPPTPIFSPPIFLKYGVQKSDPDLTINIFIGPIALGRDLCMYVTNYKTFFKT